MGDLFDDLEDDYVDENIELDSALEDDDYIDDYDDESIELDSELGTDYHEVRELDNSISRDTEYYHPELTTPSNATGEGSYVPIPQDAKRTLPFAPLPISNEVIKGKLPAKLISKGIKHVVVRHKSGKRTLLVSPHKTTVSASPGHVKKGKLPAKLRNKHGIKHVVIRHKSGKRTLLT